MNISTALQCFLSFPACWGGQCFPFPSSPHVSRFELSRGAWPGSWGQQCPQAWGPASNTLPGEHQPTRSTLLLLLQPSHAQGYSAGIIFCCSFLSFCKKRCYSLPGWQSCALNRLPVHNSIFMPSPVLITAKAGGGWSHPTWFKCTKWITGKIQFKTQRTAPHYLSWRAATLNSPASPTHAMPICHGVPQVSPLPLGHFCACPMAGGGRRAQGTLRTCWSTWPHRFLFTHRAKVQGGWLNLICVSPSLPGKAEGAKPSREEMALWGPELPQPIYHQALFYLTMSTGWECHERSFKPYSQDLS